MYFLSQEFHNVKEENENLRKENRSNILLNSYFADGSPGGRCAIFRVNVCCSRSLTLFISKMAASVMKTTRV